MLAGGAKWKDSNVTSGKSLEDIHIPPTLEATGTGAGLNALEVMIERIIPGLMR